MIQTLGAQRFKGFLMPKIAAQDSAQDSLLPKICPRKILVLS
jgi:hypothetical protein